jgi:tetratricopeptide (TPR) repeat protein
LEVSDLKLTERDADSPAGSPGKTLFTLPQQAWCPETDTADAWMVDGDKQSVTVLEENGKRFVRLTNDGTVTRNALAGYFRVDPQDIDAASMSARIRVNQYEPLANNTRTTASVFIRVTARDSLGRERKNEYLGFDSTGGWQTRSSPINIPPDTDTLTLAVVADSCRASLDIATLACTLKLRSVESERPGQASLRIRRENKVLSERCLPATLVTSNTVHLTVERLGDTLRAQVGDEQPVEVFDPFPLPSKDNRLALLTGGGDVRLHSLSVSRHSLPSKPNPLEIGDGLFAAGRFSEAQAAYEAHTRASPDLDTQQQAHYKIALCLLRQKRDKEAEPELALVAKSDSPTWSALAACQLWAYYLEQQRMEEADAVFLSLRARRDFTQVLSSLTQEMQTSINESYANRVRGMLEYSGPAEWQVAVERLPQFLEVADALNMHPVRHKHVFIMRLAELHAALGQTDRAIQLMQTEFKRLEQEDQARLYGDRGFFNNSADFYRRLLALNGRHEEALALLERLDQRVPHTLYAVTTARCLLSMNRLPGAEEKLAGVIANTAPLQDRYAYASVVAAHLLLGLITEMRQGSEAAREVWAKAFRSLRQAAGSQNPVDPIDERSRTDLCQFLLLASLSGEIRDADMPAVRKRLGDFAGQVKPGEDAKKAAFAAFAALFTRQSLIEIFSSERGGAYARKVIRGDLSRMEERLTTLVLLGEQILIQDSIGRGNLTAEVESIYWKLAQQAMEALRTDKFTPTQAIGLFAAWKGVTNLFGWESLQSELAPALRGPLAFVMGHRYIKLGKNEDALGMFQTAKQDAAQIPDGKALAKAADEAAKKLATK